MNGHTEMREGFLQSEIQMQQEKIYEVIPVVAGKLAIAGEKKKKGIDRKKRCGESYGGNAI